MRPKASSGARKCRSLELDYALPRPLIHLQLSHNRVRSRYQKLAHQPWGPLLHHKFHSHGKKSRCRELNSRLWEPLILPGSSRSERKYRCLEPGCQPLPSRRSLAQPPLRPANSRRPPMSTAPPCTATPHTASCARLLQTADIPPETARLVRCHNPWPTEDVLFCPNDALPAFVTGIPALSSGPELWIAVHNHRPEPLQLHSWADYWRPRGGDPR